MFSSNLESSATFKELAKWTFFEINLYKWNPIEPHTFEWPDTTFGVDLYENNLSPGFSLSGENIK